MDRNTVPARVSLFLTPATLVLAIAFVAAFYWATVPAFDLRTEERAVPILVLVVLALAIPVAGFWRNRVLLGAARPKERVRAAAALVFESAALLVTLLVFANMTAGGEEEAKLRDRVLALTHEALAARKQVEMQAAKRGTLAGSGAGLQLNSVAHRGESLLGKNGAVVVYDAELRALAALIPAYRAGTVDWSLFGFPARSFPEHWRAAGGSSFTRAEAGSPIEHSQELLKVATALQHEISAAAKQRGSLEGATAARVIAPSGLIDFGYVDADGRFALYSDRHGVFLLFQPAMRADGRVDWRCRSYPREAAVPGCASSLS